MLMMMRMGAEEEGEEEDDDEDDDDDQAIETKAKSMNNCKSYIVKVVRWW